MHAVTVLQKCLSSVFSQMHAVRARVLLGAVAALLVGRRLILMDLARAWPGAERVRAPLKRLDRLLGNRHLAQERERFYAAMAHWLIRQPRPVPGAPVLDIPRRDFPVPLAYSEPAR